MASMNFELGPKSKAEPITVPPVSRHLNPEDFEESRLESLKSRYSPKVLVGYWFDRRAEQVSVPNDWITVYDSTYTCKPSIDGLKRDRRCYEENRSKAKGLGTEFLIEHYKEAFYNNYATTYDLVYRVIPHGLCGPRRRKYSSQKDLWVPELDLSKNFGNVTNFGLSEAFKCDTLIKSKRSPRLSIQATSFRKPPISKLKRVPRPKGSFNEPNLTHLDIDPNKPFKPHLIQSKV